MCSDQRTRSGSAWLQATFVVLVMGMTGGSSVYADARTLSVIPNKCISLRKGQKCYQNIEVKWTGITAAEYCLWREGDTSPIDCWIGIENGSLQYQFVSEATTVFYLSDSADDNVLAKAELKVSWIYHKRNSRKSSWRLF